MTKRVLSFDSTRFFFLEPVFIPGMPNGRGFFPPDKERFRSYIDVWQGKATQYGG